MLQRCNLTWQTLEALRSFSPPQPELLDEDLAAVRMRLEVVEWAWRLLSALRPDDPGESFQKAALGQRGIVLSDDFLFASSAKASAEISTDSYVHWVRGSIYILLSEIENLRQSCARILIRQIGKDMRRSDGWNKFSDILGKSVFEFDDAVIPSARWWKNRADEICKDDGDMGDLARIRGMIQHGALDKALPSGSTLSVNRAAPSGELSPALPMDYVDRRLKDLEGFVGQFASWIQEHGFLPRLPRQG